MRFANILALHTFYKKYFQKGAAGRIKNLSTSGREYENLIQGNVTITSNNSFVCFSLIYNTNS